MRNSVRPRSDEEQRRPKTLGGLERREPHSRILNPRTAKSSSERKPLGPSQRLPIFLIRVVGGRMRTAIAMPLVALAVLPLAGCERWALDRQMEELCKRDGGVKVYERVTLPPSDFTSVGQPLGRYWKPGTPPDERLGPEYRYSQKSEILVDKNAQGERGKGRLDRSYVAIYRRADNKLLGEAVSYQRGGGDLFTFGFEPSRNACPLPSVDLAQSVFVKGR
jgi:hypothetical protein